MEQTPKLLLHEMARTSRMMAGQRKCNRERAYRISLKGEENHEKISSAVANADMWMQVDLAKYSANAGKQQDLRAWNGPGWF